MEPLAIRASGMITAVGLNAPSCCAAMRAALDGFAETRFVDAAGEWIIGAAVPLVPPRRGRARLAHMAASAISECLPSLQGISPQEVPLLLCVAEEDRPGRVPLPESQFLRDVSTVLGVEFSGASVVLAKGSVGGVEAIQRARQLIDAGSLCCLLAGSDSFLLSDTLSQYESRNRLLTSENSNGFIPGEGAAAVLLGPAHTSAPAQMCCVGLGSGSEPSSIESDQPLRGEGLAEALRSALADAGCTYDDIHYRLSDCNGEQYGFKEAALSIARTMKKVKPEFDIWHPADRIGEVGAAIVPLVLGVASAAAEKGYAPGPGVLCHFAQDNGRRAAVIVRYLGQGVA